MGSQVSWFYVKIQFLNLKYLFYKRPPNQDTMHHLSLRTNKINFLFLFGCALIFKVNDDHVQYIQ